MIEDENILKELLMVFRDEALTKITRLNRHLMLLEQKGIPLDVRKNSSEEVLRTLHTIKGNSASVGLMQLQEFIHHIESSMKKVQDETGLPESIDVYPIWFKALDIVTTIIDRGFDEKEDPARIEEIVKALGTKDAGGDGHASEGAETKTPKNKGVKSGSGKRVRTAEDTSPKDTQNASLSKDSDAGDGVIRVTVGRLERLAEGMSEILSFRLQLEQELKEVKSHYQHVTVMEDGWTKKRDAMAAIIGRAHRDGRIDDDLHNDLKNLLGEAEQNHRDRKHDSRIMVNKFQKIFNRVRQAGISMRSQEEYLRGLQMSPVALMFSSFHRTVRDTARELGKDVSFVTEGESVELDRNMVQQLREPLVHLLRNSVDHGMEPPEERERAGKPRQGKITLRAFASTGGVVIEVEDDGRGLDTSAIREKAVKSNIIQESEAGTMSEKALQALVFRPGFSTKSNAGLTSGRGVGLDVVRDWVDRIRGRMEWETTPGKGTVFRLRVPLTLATMQALIARVGENKFAIPIVSVDRVVRVAPEDIHHVESRASIFVDGAVVELASLASLLGMPDLGQKRGDGYNVVVSRSAGSAMGWIVDELLGEQEIVLKRFSKYMAHVSNLTGGAIIGNGEVVLVLNASDVHRGSSGLGSYLDALDERELDMEQRKIRVLIVDDSFTTRTLERMILAKAGYDVTEASDGVEAFDIAGREEFDLIISDIQMPRMDGVELTEKIRKNEKTKDLPVIIISFLDKEEDKLRGLRAGANAYLTKSQFSQARLLELVQQLVGL